MPSKRTSGPRRKLQRRGSGRGTLRTQVKQLDQLQKVEDVRELKTALQSALVQLEKGLDETEKRNRMVVSDLQAELSVLHGRIVVTRLADKSF